MKKKILVTLSLACMAAFSLGVSACDKPEDTEKPAQHSHNYQWVDNGNGTHKQHCAVEGCDAPDISSGDHDFTNGDCVCGAQKPAGHVHTPLEAVKENVVQPTLESEGGYDLVVRCAECGEVISTEHVNLGKLELTGTEITSKSLNKEGDRLYAKLPNGTETFRFAGDITVAEGASWLLCTDILGTQVIPTKIAPLQTGDNTFYLVVTNGNSDPMTYTVTLRVRPFYTVTFDANGGNTVPSQQIEEDDTLEELTADGKTGYTFSHWEVNEERVTFPYTVTGDTTFTAEYTANTYTVTLDVNGGDELNKTEYETVYDSAFTLATPTRTGYTFDGWYDGANKITDTEWKYTEDKTFTARWSINSYEITPQKNITTAGAVTGAGAYNYGTQATLTAETYIGYDFLGWYDGSALITEDLSFTVTVGAQNKTYTAKWEVKEEFAIFEFTSTANTVNITGIKDKTVTEIVIPDCVTSIGSSAFEYCSGLASITIPDSVTSIGSSAFYQCSSLTSITIPFAGATRGGTSNTHFGYIFGASSYSDNSKRVPSSLKTVIITSATSIGNSAFEYCSGLTSITIPDSVTSIGNSAFSGCSGLTSLTIPNGVKSIESYTFRYCDSLTNITIPDSVTSIKDYAFAGDVVNSYVYDSCRSLTSITIPFVGATKGGTSNTHFGYIFGASSYNDNSKRVPSSLKTVIITSATSIDYSAFYGCSGLTTISIPDSVTSIGNSAFYQCSSLTNITIPNGVTRIGEFTFFECSSLTSITIPNDVKSIDREAFYGCSSLASITIPDSVTSIGSMAFDACSSLTSITVSANNQNYSSQDGILYNKAKTKIEYIPKAIHGAVTISSTITSIDWSAFRGRTDLTSVTIPNSVTDIGSNAFMECSNLTSITFNGTIEQWNAITKGSDWNYSTGEYTIHCTDGDIAKS